MKIEYGIYSIEPENMAYNLFKKVVAKKKKTGEEYENNLNLGWGMRFETCIEKMITDSLADNQSTVSLREYIDEYRKIREDFLLKVKL